MDLAAMAMKEDLVFPKTPALLETHNHSVQCDIQKTRWELGLMIWKRIQLNVTEKLWLLLLFRFILKIEYNSEDISHNNNPLTMV